MKMKIKVKSIVNDLDISLLDCYTLKQEKELVFYCLDEL